jgi:hypothetical protein
MCAADHRIAPREIEGARADRKPMAHKGLPINEPFAL